MNVPMYDMTMLTRAAVSGATDELGRADGFFHATRSRDAVLFEWAGGSARRAHAALAREFERVGISAQDIPGLGVRTGLDVLMVGRPAMLFLRILRDMRAQYRTTQRRFAAKVLRRGPDECWPWTARRNGPSPRADGSVRPSYGTFAVNHRVVYAHRWALFGIAAVTRKDKVLHHCDTPLCCNPAHLYAGTDSDNLRDAESRGRLARIRGRFAKIPPPHIGDLIHSDSDAGLAEIRRALSGVMLPGSVAHVFLPVSANDTGVCP